MPQLFTNKDSQNDLKVRSRKNLLKEKIEFWIKDIYNLGFYHLLSANLFSTLLGFGSQLFVVWILTAEEIGQIRVMQSFLSYAVLLGGLGFSSSTLKLCSENRPIGEIVFLYRKSVSYSIVFSLFALLSFLALNNFGFLIQNSNYKNHLSLFLLSTIPLVFNTINSSYLQSQREIKRLSRIQAVTRSTSVVLIIILTYLNGLYGFIIANIAGNLLSSLMLSISISKISNKINAIRISNPFKLHIKYSSFAFLSNITYQASLYLDMVLLNYIVKDDPKGIGSYGFATLIISFFSLVTLSFQQVLTPVFSNISSDLNQWYITIKKYSKIYTWGILLASLVSLTILPLALKTFFGHKFERIAVFFTILFIGWILQSLYSVKSTALFSLGKLKVIFRSSLILVIVGLPLNFLLISKLHVIGACIANLIISLIGLIIYHESYARHVLRKKE